MASIKQVLTYLIEKNILKKDKISGEYKLTEYGYIHLEEQEPNKKQINYQGLAAQIRELFPNGVKSGGAYVRSSVLSLANKLKTFNNKFPGYTEEQILNATKAYVNEMSKVNYQYMKLAEYFIIKDNASILESYINNMEEESTSPVQQEAVRGKVV